MSTGGGMYGTEVLRSEPDGGDFTTQMDFAGRAVLAENPYGETTSWAYEGSQLKTVAYGFGGTDLAMEKYGYDSAGRMEWRWGPEAAVTMSASSPGFDPTKPVKVDGDLVVDGHHRVMAADRAGVDVVTTPGTASSAAKANAKGSFDEVVVDPVDWYE